MADDLLGPDSFIASRLDLLLRTVHPADRSPYSIAKVVSAINASGEATISVGYLWQLREGTGTTRRTKHLFALPRFFGVSPMYFLPEEGAALVLRDDAVREIALRAAGLSERSLQVIRNLITSVRTLDASRPDTRRRTPPQAKDTNRNDAPS